MVGWRSNVSLGGQAFGAFFFEEHFLIRTSPSCHFIPVWFLSVLKQLPPFSYQSHRISHIINRKCERGNLMSHKVKRQTFYCCFRTDFKSTSSIKKA